MWGYLDALGIDRWVLRQNGSNILSCCYAYVLCHQRENVGVLLATAFRQDIVIEQLLARIVEAIRCEFRGQWHAVQPALDPVLLNSLRFVVTLGEGFEVPKRLVHLHSYSPDCLLEQPALKKETWKKLQAVFPLLS